MSEIDENMQNIMICGAGVLLGSAVAAASGVFAAK